MIWWVRNTKIFVSGLNHIENLLILTSVVTKCVSTSTFASLVGIPVGMVSFAVGLKTCAITGGIKMYNTTKCYFIGLLEVNEYALTVNLFY